MQKIIISLFLCFSALILRAEGQSCGIQGVNSSEILLPPLPEGLEGGVVFARMQLVNVKSTATIAHPHNIYLAAQRYANGVYELLTNDLFPDFVTLERTTEIRRMSRLTCDDDTNINVLFIVPVPDTNDKPPTFNGENYEVEVHLPLVPEGADTLVETTIVVSDLDLDFSNADLHFTSSNRYIQPKVTELWSGTNPPVYEYKVDLLVDNEIAEGSYTLIITADDGRHPVTALVRVEVIAAGTPEPEPTEAPTTEAPTTEEPTTEEPTTEEPTTEEPTTEEPTTEEPTTTEEPVPVGCGFVDLDPSVPITLSEPLEPILPIGTEIWRSVQYNVNSTTASNHPHNRYITALRSSTNYWFITTNVYNNFLAEEGTNIVQRTVNLNCLDGSRVTYTFALEINDGPIEEPTIPPRHLKRNLF